MTRKPTGRPRAARVAITILSVAIGLAGDRAAGAEPVPAGGRADVLGGGTRLRYRMTYRTPETVDSAGKVALAEEGKPPAPMPAYATPLPDAAWTEAAFDHTGWSRGTVPVEVSHGGRIYRHLEAHTAFRAYVRGNFLVTDPAAVRDMRVDVDYVGGAAVYVNGKEVARGHVPGGSLTDGTRAERYPDETFLDAEGFLTSDLKKDGERLNRRIRTLRAIGVPAELLRKGLNVVAVEVHRAPASRSLLDVKSRKDARILPHLGLLALKVTAASPAGVSGDAGGLKDARVWACGPCDMVLATDPGEFQDPVLPIRMVGARNGTFSGRVAVSAPRDIRNLKASASDLEREGGGGTIPASAVRVRFAERASEDKGWVATRNEARFDVLLDAAPGAAPIATPRGPVAAACIWATVKVGKNVPPGEYAGRLSVVADGLAPTQVPVRLSVSGWTLPDPGDFSVRNCFFPSHESVALYHGAPFWSERHLESMGRGMEMLAGIGCRMATINVVKNYQCMGNTESMVKWIRNPDGGYRHDFSAVDKYLETVSRHMGRPAFVRLNVWSERGKVNRQVSLLDPATGRLEDLTDPATSDTAATLAFWTPVLAGLRERLERRGWLDVAAFGYTSYTADPPPEIVSLMAQMWKGAQGYKSSHSNANVWKGANGEAVKVICNEGVWGSGRLYDPDRAGSRSYPAPWKNTARKADLSFPREGVQNFDLLRSSFTPLAGFRAVPESCLQGNLDGIGNVGADFWPLKQEDERGRPRRYTQANQHQLGPGSCLYAILSPGPDGPAGNERYEMFREGVQIVEAMVFLQKALDSGKADGATAARIRALLDDRARAYLRTFRGMWPPPTLWSLYAGSGVQERDRALFALCAEVKP